MFHFLYSLGNIFQILAESGILGNRIEDADGFVSILRYIRHLIIHADNVYLQGGGNAFNLSGGLFGYRGNGAGGPDCEEPLL